MAKNRFLNRNRKNPFTAPACPVCQQKAVGGNKFGMAVCPKGHRFLGTARRRVSNL